MRRDWAFVGIGAGLLALAAVFVVLAVTLGDDGCADPLPPRSPGRDAVAIHGRPCEVDDWQTDNTVAAGLVGAVGLPGLAFAVSGLRRPER